MVFAFLVWNRVWFWQETCSFIFLVILTSTRDIQTASSGALCKRKPIPGNRFRVRSEFKGSEKSYILVWNTVGSGFWELCGTPPPTPSHRDKTTYNALILLGFILTCRHANIKIWCEFIQLTHVNVLHFLWPVHIQVCTFTAHGKHVIKWRKSRLHCRSFFFLFCCSRNQLLEVVCLWLLSFYLLAPAGVGHPVLLCHQKGPVHLLQCLQTAHKLSQLKFQVYAVLYNTKEIKHASARGNL